MDAPSKPPKAIREQGSGEIYHFEGWDVIYRKNSKSADCAPNRSLALEKPGTHLVTHTKIKSISPSALVKTIIADRLAQNPLGSWICCQRPTWLLLLFVVAVFVGSTECNSVAQYADGGTAIDKELTRHARDVGTVCICTMHSTDHFLLYNPNNHGTKFPDFVDKCRCDPDLSISTLPSVIEKQLDSLEVIDTWIKFNSWSNSDTIFHSLLRINVYGSATNHRYDIYYTPELYEFLIGYSDTENDARKQGVDRDYITHASVTRELINRFSHLPINAGERRRSSVKYMAVLAFKVLAEQVLMR